MKKNLPNLLTISRAIAGIIIFILLWKNIDVLAAIVFFIFLTTDFFDGFLARKWYVESDLGKQLEPICDFMLIMSAIFSFILKGYFSATFIVTVGIILLISYLIWFISGGKFKQFTKIFGFLWYIIFIIIVSAIFLISILGVNLPAAIILIAIVFLLAVSINLERIKNRITINKIVKL